MTQNHQKSHLSNADGQQHKTKVNLWTTGLVCPFLQWSCLCCQGSLTFPAPLELRGVCLRVHNTKPCKAPWRYKQWHSEIQWACREQAAHSEEHKSFMTATGFSFLKNYKIIKKKYQWHNRTTAGAKRIRPLWWFQMLLIYSEINPPSPHIQSHLTPTNNYAIWSLKIK